MKCYFVICIFPSGCFIDLVCRQLLENELHEGTETLMCKSLNSSYFAGKVANSRSTLSKRVNIYGNAVCSSSFGCSL